MGELPLERFAGAPGHHREALTQPSCSADSSQRSSTSDDSAWTDISVFNPRETQVRSSPAKKPDGEGLVGRCTGDFAVDAIVQSQRRDRWFIGINELIVRASGALQAFPLQHEVDTPRGGDSTSAARSGAVGRPRSV